MNAVSFKNINPFCNDFFYKEESVIIADAILDSLSKGILSFDGLIDWQYNCNILNSSAVFEWRFNVIRDDSDFIKENGYDIWASAGANECDDPSVHITIILPKGKWAKKAEIDRAVLIGVAAHEIHHIAQNTEENAFFETNDNEFNFTDPSKRLKYLVSSVEVEAFMIGFRAESYFSGVPEVEIMRTYLTHLQISNRDIEKIINIWASTEFEVLRTNIGDM